MKKQRIMVLVSLCVFLINLEGTEPKLPEEKEISATGEIDKKISRVRQAVEGKKKRPSNTIKRITADVENRNADVSLGKLTIQLVFGMVFIVMLIVVSLRMLKRVQSSRILRGGAQNNGLLEVLETCYLGKDQKVVAMRIDNQTTILGVTPSSIQLLKETGFSQVQKEVKPIQKEKQVAVTAINKSSNTSEFSESLNQFLTKFKKTKTVTQSLEEL